MTSHGWLAVVAAVGMMVADAGTAGQVTNAAAAPAATNAVRCAVCWGARVVRCPTCRGAKFGPDAEVKVPCRACGGTGKWTRPRTVTLKGGIGGRNETLRTGGTISGPCANCKGTGGKVETQRTYCTACEGRGWVRCPVCGKAK